jgi:hypothetical protein
MGRDAEGPCALRAQWQSIETANFRAAERDVQFLARASPYVSRLLLQAERAMNLNLGYTPKTSSV